MKKAKSALLRVLLKKIHFCLNEGRSAEQTDKAVASRRKFLEESAKGMLALGIGLSIPSVLSSCLENPAKSAGSTKKGVMPKIAIIGAGIAGLNCGYRLLQNNIDFCIYEGNRRTGGRILTHYNDALGAGIFPEFGGDFIDSNHTDMLNLAKEFNLELVDLLKDQQDKKLIKDIFFFDDRIISEKQVLREFSKISIKIARDIDSLDENYRNAAAIRLDHLPLSEYFNGLKCAKWLKELLSAAYVAEYGLDCSEQSTLNFLDLINPKTSSGFEVFGDSDERFRIKGGNSKIIEGLERKIGEQRIKKEHLLTEVLEMDNGQYAMIFSNKTVVVADYVVLTLPFTMLRNVKLRLKSISKEKKQCIDELGYGTNTKLVLAYHGTPWNNDLNKAYGYLFHKNITNGWDSSLNRTAESTYGAYVCFFGGKYAEKLHAESFKNPSAPPFHVWKTALPEETVGGIVNELDRIFLQSAKSYTGKHVFVNWIDYPYAKGSYSCFKVGQWTSMSGKALEPTGKVFFTGEHCSKDFMGFMNGAAETGRQVAETIAELLLKK